LVAYAFDKQTGLWAVLVTSSTAQILEISNNDDPKFARLPGNLKRIRDSLALDNSPFDMRIAHELYKTLFEPLRAYLSDIDQIVIVPDENLAFSPFPALVESFDEGGKESVRWFAHRYTTALALSINGFVALRAPPDRPLSFQTFVGFANPVVDKDPSCPAESAWGRRSTGPSKSDTAVLCSEPKTLDHVSSLATGLGADPETAIVSAADLTKEAIVARLQHPVRVVVFATHGLISREAFRVVGVPEPGLLLSKPAAGGAARSRYLAMSEIELLTIDANLVILSACNTAADGGELGG
jgi:CHAT domain-containing protein